MSKTAERATPEQAGEARDKQCSGRGVSIAQRLLRI